MFYVESMVWWIILCVGPIRKNGNPPNIVWNTTKMREKDIFFGNCNVNDTRQELQIDLNDCRRSYRQSLVFKDDIVPSYLFQSREHHDSKEGLDNNKC